MNGILPRFKSLFFCCALQLMSNLTAAQQLPVSAFSQLPEFERPALSPNGTKLAYINNLGGSSPSSLLATIDLTKGERFLLLNSDNEKVKINWYRWANEETLLISARYESSTRGTKYYETRLFAMEYNMNNEPARRLVKARRGGDHISQFQDNVINWLPDDPKHVLVAVDIDIQFLPSVYKMNIDSGRLKRLEKGKLEIRDWITDQQSQLRVGVSMNYNDGDSTIYVRRKAGKGEDWDKLYTYNAMTEAGITPVGFGLDPNLLYFRQYNNDKLALYTWNLTTDEQALIYADPDYDVTGRLLYSASTRDVIGIAHSNTSTGRIYWDPRYKALMGGLEKAFPDTDNYLVSFDQTENAYIFYNENDYTPGAYYLGNRKDKTISLLFEQYPALVSAVTEHKKVSYKTRDGIEIEGYLTLPESPEEGPFPTILHPHGGPGARDYSGFDYWTSFFVNLGYAVFRPNFRGSAGYGYSFAKSQMKSWGLEMQDDLSDAAQWLIDTEVADPDKICIVGASYGGYATMMAATKTPDLFTCGVSLAGVSNLR